MITQVRSLFYKPSVIRIIRQMLPQLFYHAEMECSRDNKVGMEVGVVREKILTAMLMNFLHKSKINTNVSVTEPETDVRVSKKNLSIRTTQNIKSVKLTWTVDKEKILEFVDTYHPKADILLAHIKWIKPRSSDVIFKDPGGLYHIPLEAAHATFLNLGKNYFAPIKHGTNHRGIQYSIDAIHSLVGHPLTSKMDIEWIRPIYEHDGYGRWFEMWRSQSVYRKYSYHK